jgi:alpha-amylase
MIAMSKLYLILAFHNHQPVGNFDHVLEDAYQKSYLPFLETLMRYKKLKVVLHYSGHLLSWIQNRHPDTIKLIRSLVVSNRAEILSGGFYEPVLSVLPERDKLSQINEFSKFIQDNLGYTPQGLWLAERVWEPQMPQFISQAGMQYLAIDDFHFKMTGLEEGDLLGYYITEDQAYTVSVFPGSEKLRYYIPFKSVEETISYFREIAMRGGNPLLTFADDGETFGVWPNTYKHCFEDRWLDNFFAALEENADWIETTTFREYHDQIQPLGIAYLPTASYREMGEWTLPSESGLEYQYALEQLGNIMGEKAKYLLRGGIWRSFMAKYPESNHLHKRMFMISDTVHKALQIDSKKGRQAQMELWKGQCNDAYWHGVFGGLYLPHLRSALYRHLLTAESIAHEILHNDCSAKVLDFDCDGYNNVLVHTNHINLVASENGGCVTELSLNKKAVNILDIISKRPESYHAKLVKTTDAQEGKTKTIHEISTVKEDGLSDYLTYDSYRRSSFLDHFFPADTTVQHIISSEYEELGDFVSGIYAMDYAQDKKNIALSFSRDGNVRQDQFRIAKSIQIKEPQSIMVDYALQGEFSGLFAIEMNISLLGSPHALIRMGTEYLDIRNTGIREHIDAFNLADRFLNMKIAFKFSEPITVWYYPVETVSLSEQGIERLYQGTSFLFVSRVALNGMKKLALTMDFEEDMT